MAKISGHVELRDSDNLSQTLQAFVDKASEDLKAPLKSIVVNTETLMLQTQNSIEKTLLSAIMDAALKIESTIKAFPSVEPINR